MHLTRSYNPDFFTDDVLSEIPLLPQHAWDKESASGKVGNYDETAAGAKAVYAFLQKQGGDLATFTTNPLWKVVDGPWQLSAFSSDGDYTYVPNKNYSGPDKPTLDSVVNDVYNSDSAELDALRSGGTLTVGTLPQNDLPQASVLKSDGYSIANQPIPGVSGIIPNLYNAKVGPVLQQLYIRQALEDLIDRTQIVSKIYDGYADPGNGPVPVEGFSQWTSPLEKSGGPYPYDPAKAIGLLKAHGWKVTPNGTSTCQRPGTGAGRLRGRHRGRAAAVVPAALLVRLHHRRRGRGLDPELRGAGGRRHQPQVRAVQLADLHRRRLQRNQPPGLDLRLAAGRLRLRPV